MLSDYDQLTEHQKDVLKHFVSNTTDNVFVLKNLPEVIKGALFSKYSRSTRGLRSLLVKEFILNEDTSFESIVGQSNTSSEVQEQAIKRAQNFYDRILDGYGDDSIGELGGAHLALENVSMLATKVIEDCRIGGSPLEKSTRYVYFDQKVDGEYLFHKEEALMTSAYRDDYISMCNELFQTYSQLIPPLTEKLEEEFPKSPEVSDKAYAAALRARVLDCLRGLLPASTLTNMGVFGNGRFFEGLVQKLHASPLLELQGIGLKSYNELNKVIPSFVRRAEPGHRHNKAYLDYQDKVKDYLHNLSHRLIDQDVQEPTQAVKLISSSPDVVNTLLSHLLFEGSDASLSSIKQIVSAMSKEEKNEIFEELTSYRTNRRHKAPRAAENVYFTFEVTADYGSYRDLQRHRMLTQERQRLTCSYGYYIPEQIKGTHMQKTYCNAMDRAKKVYDVIAQELPEEAQYVVPMGYAIRWYYTINLRALQWLCELRSAPQGHHTYRLVAQEMADAVCKQYPELKGFLSFVDYEGYSLGRLDQEIRKEKKRKEALV